MKPTETDVLREVVNAGRTSLAFDLPGNGTVSQPSPGCRDMDELLLIIRNACRGAADLNEAFDSSDIALTAVAGRGGSSCAQAIFSPDIGNRWVYCVSVALEPGSERGKV